MKTERYGTPLLTQHHFNIGTDSGVMIACMTRRASRRDPLSGTFHPRSWTVATIEGSERFATWDGAKAAIRRAMAAA